MSPEAFRPRLRVDFNCPDLFAILKAGDVVVAFDGEGNECDAIVERIEAGHRGASIIRLSPDYESWRNCA